MFDGKAFGLEIVGAVRAHIDKSLSPLKAQLNEFGARLAQLEARVAETPAPRDGDPGPPGKDADVTEILQLVDQRFAAYSTNTIGVELLDATVQRSVDQRMAEAVSKIDLPAPQAGKDGVGLSGGFINKAGELVLTTTSGNITVLDRVVGRDGEKGERGEPGPPGVGEKGDPGKDADLDALAADFARLSAEMSTKADEQFANLKSQLAKEIESMGEVVGSTLGNLEARIEELGASIPARAAEEVAKAPAIPGPQGEPGPAGKNADPIDMTVVHDMIADQVKSQAPVIISKEIAELPPAERGEQGLPGKDADPVDVSILRVLITDEVAVQAPPVIAAEVAKIPPPERGEPGAPGRDAEPVAIDTVRGMVIDEVRAHAEPLIVAHIGAEIGKLPPGPPGEQGPPGKDADPVAIETIREIVVDEVRTQAEPLVVARVGAEIAALPPAAPGEQGPPGRDAEPISEDAVRGMISTEVVAVAEPLVKAYVVEEVSKIPPAEQGPRGEPGPPIPLEVVRGLIVNEVKTNAEPLIVAHVADEVAKLPPAERGEKGEPGRDAEPTPLAVVRDIVVEHAEPIIKAQVVEEIGKLPPPERGEKGEPGRDADPFPVESAKELIAIEVKRAFDAAPKPTDGHTPTEEELRALVCPIIEKGFSELPERVSVANSIIDRSGSLVQTMSDGSVNYVGPVVGRDGKDADMEQILAAMKERVAAELAKWDRPRDGMDGVGIDDLRIEHDGERTITFTYSNADKEKKFIINLPGMVIDRGVFKDDRKYEAGDGTTYGGSYWICERDDPGVPGRGESGWRLAAKSGRPGKDGKDVDVSRISAVEAAILEIKRLMRERG